MGAGGAVSADRRVLIALTDEQVAHVAQQASPRPAELLPELSSGEGLREVVLPLLEKVWCSRSVLRALLVLDALPLDGSGRGILDIARTLDISPSTTHRYMNTWMSLGLVQQNPRSRRYRRTWAGHTEGIGGPPTRPGGRGAL